LWGHIQLSCPSCGPSRQNEDTVTCHPTHCVSLNLFLLDCEFENLIYAVLVYNVGICIQVWNLMCVMYVNRIKQLHKDRPRSSSQSHQTEREDTQRSSAAASGSRSRDRQSHNVLRSTTDRSSTLRTSRPYAAGLAAQLSQRRKQLEARAKEKIKMELENVAKSPAVDSEGPKTAIHLNSPSVKETNKKKVVIEIHDDDEQDTVDCPKELSVDLANGLPQVSVKADDTSVKDDDTNTSTTDGSTSTTDGSSVSSGDTQNDKSKSDAGQTSESLPTSIDSSTTKSTCATVSLINLPMPPVASESDSEATPASTEELQP